MAFYSIIEINHDKANVWRTDFLFGEILYTILAGKFQKDTIKEYLQHYGIKILNQHHSSKQFKIIEK